MRILKALWTAWLSIAHVIGTVVTWVLMNIAYLLVAPVFSLVRFADPLKLKRGADSYWEDKRAREANIEDLTHPF